jgi:hypothetical protein
MGQGIQQPPVQQAGFGSAFADVVKVLYEPGAVFERTRERPYFFVPFLAIVVTQIVLFFLNMPFMKAVIQAQMAARGAPTGAAPMGMIIGISMVSLVLFFALITVLSTLLLWVLVMLFGGEGKFMQLLTVVCYAAIPAGILLGIVGTIVLHMKGTGAIASPQDMQPQLGLDLLAPAARGFVGAVLKGINPFSIWGVVLTAIGVSTTHRLSKSTGYTIAALQFAIALLIIGSLAAAFAGRTGG